jgi:predicted RNA-binding protein associated with RNAse of E/G family
MPDGKMRVLDEDKLHEKVKEGYITQNLAEKIEKEWKKIITRLETDPDILV